MGHHTTSDNKIKAHQTLNDNGCVFPGSFQRLSKDDPPHQGVSEDDLRGAHLGLVFRAVLIGEDGSTQLSFRGPPEIFTNFT